MTFTETAVPGAFVVEPAPVEDARGCFVRLFDQAAFAARGLNTAWLQSSASFNRRRGQVRGLHYQVAPAVETKLVRCTAGAIYDVVVDLRAGSPAYGRWAAVELSAANRRQLYVPAGCAHGFQTLEDGCEVFYEISAPYAPELAHGYPHDDPAFGIPWPLPVVGLNERDRGWPRFPAAPC